MRQLDELAGTLGIQEPKPEPNDEPASDGKPKGGRARGRGTGRRNLRALPLEEERIELPDPHLERLVQEGKIVRHGFDESAKLVYKRGGKRRVIIARVRYKAVDPARGRSRIPGSRSRPDRTRSRRRRGALNSPRLDHRKGAAEATGRKAWLFCGSDDHARSTAALFSVVASARLHGLDVEEYLRCLIRLVPLWPEDRMLELAPLFWSRTRARLDADQLEVEIGWVTIPRPLDTSASTEQPAAS